MPSYAVARVTRGICQGEIPPNSLAEAGLSEDEESGGCGVMPLASDCGAALGTPHRRTSPSFY
ncbi:hypothetical protein CCR75_006748 [Bremia lactucae]|uniref:Uncharacterized protein n=1 Tax=Bremia lactucae TaxID=4779 RepID=A0A976FK82_BRELC|nr:hypothetical protein CCR75_006748 [Bremia lactucae]